MDFVTKRISFSLQFKDVYYLHSKQFLMITVDGR